MKSLITITTCNRLNEVKKFIWDYLRFCNNSQDFDFLLALDGFEQEYLDFAANYKIPILYSEEREGVGLSKNRVFQKFPDYDFYFFVEDDVELLDGLIFHNHIKAYEIFGYPHLTFTYPREIFKKEEKAGFKITYAMLGSAHFNFFEGEALRRVGGWNTLFAKYKRYGHTEHSYRFFNLGMQPAPFLVLEEETRNLIIHNPPHVSLNKIRTNKNQLISEEEELIYKKTTYFPLETLSQYFFCDQKLKNNSVISKKRYPFIFGKERRVALAEHYFYRFIHSKKISQRYLFLFLSLLNNPFNSPLKHFIKLRFLKKWKAGNR